jgi:glycine/D-amino acid oxidase-like deaminating enzyme
MFEGPANTVQIAVGDRFVVDVVECPGPTVDHERVAVCCGHWSNNSRSPPLGRGAQALKGKAIEFVTPPAQEA